MDYKEIIAASELYWETDGKEGAIADLSRLDLSDANLNNADLSNANLSNADLIGAYLNNAKLIGANLSDADLREAKLIGANLSDADLREANLSRADLREANLSRADLREANLREANLREANLSGANLRDADLSNVDLRGANLSGAIGIAPITENAIAILLQVADRVVGQPQALKMKGVHTCDTAHCGGGWVCYLSPIAATLEKILGWNVAACIVCPIPEFTGLFYSTDAEMMAFLTSVKADRGAALKAKYLCSQ
jgi:hypothetical protein